MQVIRNWKRGKPRLSAAFLTPMDKARSCPLKTLSDKIRKCLDWYSAWIIALNFGEMQKRIRSLCMQLEAAKSANLLNFVNVNRR